MKYLSFYEDLNQITNPIYFIIVPNVSGQNLFLMGIQFFVCC